MMKRIPSLEYTRAALLSRFLRTSPAETDDDADPEIEPTTDEEPRKEDSR